MSDLVIARNCCTGCMARMRPEEAELVWGMNMSANEGKSVRCFERSDGLDTALYKNYLHLLQNRHQRRTNSQPYKIRTWHARVI